MGQARPGGVVVVVGAVSSRCSTIIVVQIVAVDELERQGSLTVSRGRRVAKRRNVHVVERGQAQRVDIRVIKEARQRAIHIGYELSLQRKSTRTERQTRCLSGSLESQGKQHPNKY